ncbi:hypothetical protein [Duganella sp. Dugasp56]|jgi:hypothetical protein|uniref:hypothetical protein n=1 Tax=Duganella sp. Dugasp56 TaxID=3243046 RepID=UPI0039B10366
MKIYDVEIPADLEIPELDAKTRTEIDAVHDELERREEEVNRQAELPPYTGGQSPEAADPYPPPSINVAALRQLPPHVRAIFAYVLREHVTY